MAEVVQHDMAAETVAFVILHYMADALTQECVDSLLALGEADARHDVRCVVVDNASGNGSLERLVARYGSDNPRVRFIANNANLGFSRANNIGYRYACDAWSPRFVVVLNNDTVIRQKDFLAVLDRVDAEHEPYVIGPDIFVERAGFHQSPSSEYWPPERIRRHCENYRNPPLKTRVHDIVKWLVCLFPPARNHINRQILLTKARNERWKTERADPVVLHGACIIFTSRFVSTGEAPFVPETFLYEEEMILAVRCRREGWQTFYTPELQIIHHDDGATDFVFHDEAKKRKFVRSNELASMRVLLDYLDEGEA